MPDTPYPFTPEFQRALAYQLIGDPAVLQALAPHLKPKRIMVPEARLLIEESLAHYSSFQLCPSPVVVMQRVRKRVEDGKVTVEALQDCGRYLIQAKADPPTDREFLLKEVLNEERKAAMFAALERGMDLFQRGDYDRIKTTVDQASLIGKVDARPSLNLRKSLAARTKARKAGGLRPRFGVGIPELDDMLKGGLAAGELGCVLGGPKFGKSQFLDQAAVHMASIGGTAVLVTLEMAEDQVADRHDAAIAGVEIDDLAEYADQVEEKVGEWYEKHGGSIIVKYMPPKRTSANDIRAYLQKERMDSSVVPNLLVVDYGDLLSPNDKAKGDSRYESLGDVYTELHDLLNDLSIPGWTASQANRSSLSKEVVTSGDIAESFKKVAVCDALVAICRTEQDRVDNLVSFYLAVCRFAKDGVKTAPYETALSMGRIVAHNGGAA